VSLLGVRAARVSFGATVAVDGVDLDAYRGEICALIGPNGAGKSTLLDAIAGTVRSEGRVVLDGAELTGLPPHARARLGLARTFQTPALLGPTPRQEVTLASCRRRGAIGGLFLAPGRHEQATAAELLERMEVPVDLWDAPSAELGLTEQRRVELARALATGPRLLMLDEPAAGLPGPDRLRFASLLRSLPGPDLGLLLVEHDMALVAAVAHVVVALDRGRMVTTGSYAAVATDPVVRASYLGDEQEAAAT
jgi:ABC-type branched-subunit amino acid transport system ATPase component